MITDELAKIYTSRDLKKVENDVAKKVEKY
jgi:hypothetical protein